MKKIQKINLKNIIIIIGIGVFTFLFIVEDFTPTSRTVKPGTIGMKNFIFIGIYLIGMLCIPLSMIFYNKVKNKK